MTPDYCPDCGVADFTTVTNDKTLIICRGCSWSVTAEYLQSTQGERSRKWRATPRGQYSVHKHNAAVRGIEFKLTFDQWWGIWQRSGHWEKRGNRKGHYVMCRKGDIGPYAVGNVYIGSFSHNTADRNKSVVVKRHTARSTTVTYKNGPTWAGEPWHDKASN